MGTVVVRNSVAKRVIVTLMPAISFCLLYTSDAADEEDSVDLGGRRIIKKIFFFNDTATTEIYTILFVGSVRCV